MVTSLKCPTCGKVVREPGLAEPMGYFPFCSERCQLVDLGRWLDGKYQIPVEDTDAGDSGDDVLGPGPGPAR
jgi:endogenous inhibitor of DNA gyrase (YacG/DUF329 family)